MESRALAQERLRAEETMGTVHPQHLLWASPELRACHWQSLLIAFLLEELPLTYG